MHRNASKFLPCASLFDQHFNLFRKFNILQKKLSIINQKFINRGSQSSASAHKKKDERQEEEQKERPLISLILQKSLQSKERSLPEASNKNHDKQHLKEISEKLKKLSKEIESNDYHNKNLMVSNFSTVQESNHAEKSRIPVNNISKKDDFVEDIFLQKDFDSLTPKPSPLLGTEDQTVPPSNAPCTGCGAILQCQHSNLPGFMPSERFKLLTKWELKESICQRCHYMKHCNAFVEVTTDPQDYSEMISKIKLTQSVVVMVIDVMDIQGSIVPNLMDYIGFHHPLIVVGNKADLLAPDSIDYLVKIKNAIVKSCREAGLQNVRRVTLISAKTGFGIERLINTLFSFYENNVNVYIVGTANAGKSSLFNTLLASDYCNEKARDLIQRATVSAWPGTTLSLLKFPIMPPFRHVIEWRHKRLRQEVAIKKEIARLKFEKNIPREKEEEVFELREDVNMTDLRTKKERQIDAAGKPWGQDVFAIKAGNTGLFTPSSFASPVRFKESKYERRNWMYDTPGVINPEQTFNLLEPEECRFLHLVNPITPRCVLISPGSSVFISGLARLDFVEGCEEMIIVVHSSGELPIRIGPMEKANDYYLKYLGKPELAIPLGDQKRLDRFPSLVAKEFQIEGEHQYLHAAADVQLSSIGWVSIAPERGSFAKIRAYTPGGKGIALRTPPLLPNCQLFKGKKIKGTPFYQTIPVGNNFIGKQFLGENEDRRMRN